jgi:5'-nucleotidase
MYLDMDGCLTGFDTAVESLGQAAAEGLSDDASELQKQVMYDAIEEAQEKFWSTMPWAREGKQLWVLVQPFNPTLLTSPGLFSYAEGGKLQWIKRNIPGTPVFFSDSKSEYVDPYEPCVLIDDNKTNIAAWKDEGGIGILHTSLESTEKELLELMWEAPTIEAKLKYW